MITFEYKDLAENLTQERLIQIYLIWSFPYFLQHTYYWLFGGQDIRVAGLQVWLSIQTYAVHDKIPQETGFTEAPKEKA